MFSSGSLIGSMQYAMAHDVFLFKLYIHKLPDTNLVGGPNTSVRRVPTEWYTVCGYTGYL